MRISISVIWGHFLFFLRFFCVFHTFFLPFSRSRIMETVLGIINESFDSILGANSGGSSEEQNLERWLDGLHAWQHAVRNIFPSFNRLTSYYIKISISNRCAAPVRDPVWSTGGIKSVNWVKTQTLLTLCECAVQKTWWDNHLRSPGNTSPMWRAAFSL